MMHQQSIKFPVPSPLVNAFFFEAQLVEMKQPLGSLSENFSHEILYFNGLECFKPWEQLTISVPFLKEEWRSVREELEELFRRREQKDILLKMKKGIGLFLQLLFWSNNQPVVLKEPIALGQLGFKPINIEERLSFILSRPTLFHSFRQLSELMEEQQKLLVKKMTMKKASKPLS